MKLTDEQRSARIRNRQLKSDGPMYCQGESCVEFRKREPKFCQALQEVGIIAHYMGKDDLWGGDYFMLSGITPIGRGGLERMIRERAKP